ncbi:DUF4105 domain-containing protein [Pseudoalteromonas citrea]|uniref:Uncharacterized protein n=1 Tax=Pseudoalteromonas citrea DSM 8771 TaxID=1117314 RepID=U1JKL0_9GAMM|nr:DUF4105 domain-containing protein [Pseudoalteromonas citrea]
MEKILSEKPYWLKLGHYKKGLYGFVESEVDDPRFFLSKNGKFSPIDELKASIHAFSSEQLSQTEKAQSRCKFPARYTWLKKHYYKHWPDLDCPELIKWKSTINPMGLTLVFPTAFMNSPSSMFGHTLLRIDAKDQTRSKELVAFAVNFAAEPDSTDNAALYALKGLVGSYPGKFTLMPYYRKVREYSDIESRDIWEYPLNFDESQVQRILLHLWEMQQATFDYYFISENCSYQLLSLLQLAKEDLDLTSEFNFKAIPSDTVAVLRDSELLEQPKYRPAFGTKLHHYAGQLSFQGLNAAKGLIRGEKLPVGVFSEKQTAAIYELAYEWLNFNYHENALNRGEIAPRLRSLLYERSKLKVSSPLLPPPRPLASPELGHGSSRIGVGENYYKYGQQSLNMSYRLAYHDLLDAPAGFIGGAKIGFFDISAISNASGLYLDQLYLIDAMSLAPDNTVFDSWSWKMKLGFERQPDIDSKRVGRVFAEAGYGKSIGDPQLLHGYILGTVAVNGGDISQGINIGAGFEAGVTWQISEGDRISLSGRWLALSDSNSHKQHELAIRWNTSLSQNWSVRAEVIQQNWHSQERAAKLLLLYYF